MSTAVQRNGSVAVADAASFGRILVFGDLHGDLQTLQAGLRERRSDDLLVFLGDYADRGPQGVEVIDVIDGLMQRDSDHTVALMGNHESYAQDGTPLFAPCTLMDEARRKRGSWEAYFSSFREFASRLSLAAVVPGLYLFVHGGVGSGIRGLADLETPDAGLVDQTLWGDPGNGPGMRPSPRGAGAVFGEDVTREVTARLGVGAVFRSHEPRKAMSEPREEHGGVLVTTSSTTVYGGRPYVLVLPVTPEDPSGAASASPSKWYVVRFLD